MLNKKQRSVYNSFYESTIQCEYLDSRTEILIGLAAAMSLNCSLCQRYYLLRAKKNGITKGELSDVLAKVMAVSAGQKRLQADDALKSEDMSIDDFK